MVAAAVEGITVAAVVVSAACYDRIRGVDPTNGQGVGNGDVVAGVDDDAYARLLAAGIACAGSGAKPEEE